MNKKNTVHVRIIDPSQEAEESAGQEGEIETSEDKEVTTRITRRVTSTHFKASFVFTNGQVGTVTVTKTDQRPPFSGMVTERFELDQNTVTELIELLTRIREELVKPLGDD